MLISLQRTVLAIVDCWLQTVIAKPPDSGFFFSSFAPLRYTTTINDSQTKKNHFISFNLILTRRLFIKCEQASWNGWKSSTKAAMLWQRLILLHSVQQSMIRTYVRPSWLFKKQCPSTREIRALERRSRVSLHYINASCKRDDLSHKKCNKTELIMQHVWLLLYIN